MLEKGGNISGIVASEIMTVKPKSIDHQEFAVRALQIMQEKSITQLVVTKDGKLAGFIHLHDLLREGIA
jgi:arabinose-5-phosphate isomerase